MRLTYKTDRSELTVEGGDVKEVFEEMAAAQEVFSNSVCGACDSHNTRLSVREVDGNRYYACKCSDCGAELAFGQKRDGGTLFPKKKDKDGNWLSGNGWVKYQPKKTVAVDDPF